MDVAVIGGGIGGLTLALKLHQVGIPCKVFEAAPEIAPLGLGINLLPNVVRDLDDLGLMGELQKRSITTKEACFYNRFGQLIYTEKTGLFGGYDWPQFSIHRGDLQMPLLDAFLERSGPDNLFLGHHCTHVEQDADGVTLHFKDTTTGETLPAHHADVAIGCDGLHSMLRKQLHPNEGDPIYSGYNMWRGVTRWKPFLSGASMVRAGWFKTGKLVIYPIRDNIDDEGRQLINWVVEIEVPNRLEKRDWNRAGDLKDFLWAFKDWRFKWLDVPELLSHSDMILEFPMIDQQPLTQWSFGRLSLLGDAAHPMYPRGSNGACQAILDARALANALKEADDPIEALRVYDNDRCSSAAKVVLMNRKDPPDAILREVFERTGDKPFENVDDVISHEELVSFTSSYKKVTGYDLDKMKKQQSIA